MAATGRALTASIGRSGMCGAMTMNAASAMKASVATVSHAEASTP